MIGAAYAKALGMLLEFYVSSVRENLPADPEWGVQAEGSEDTSSKQSVAVGRKPPELISGLIKRSPDRLRIIYQKCLFRPILRLWDFSCGVDGWWLSVRTRGLRYSDCLLIEK